MKGINCFLSNALTRRWAIKYKLPEAIILKIQQTAEAETKPDGITTEKFIEQKIENYIERLNGSTAQRTAVPHYTGDVNPEENTIFVFGSNPTGYHGAGAAKDAANRFGAIYGQGEGLQGSAYALPTKRIDKKPEGITDIVAPMTFSFDGKQRLGVMSSTTFEAIINGERTATTRYLTGDEKSRKHIDALSRAKVGDIITFTDTDFKGKVYVRVTKPLTLLDEKTDPNEWSQKEGWSTDHFKYVVRPKIEARQAYQLEFEYVGANGERTVTPKEIIKNIQTLYGVAAQHPDKQFKIGYRNVGTFKTLNGYSGRELMLMFLSAGRIPSNVVFSAEWASDPYFSNLYAEIQKDSSKSKEKPILKKEFRGKLIFASPSAGKTSIADNVDIIDEDYILANILGVPTALVKDAMDLAYKAGQSVGIANQYAQAIQEYLKAGKTVITARLASLPMAHIIVHRESADDIVEVSNRDRENKGLNSTDAAKVQEKILEEVGKRGSGESVTLSKTQFLGDILLENPSYNLGSLEGKAEQRSQTKSLSNIIAEFLGEFGIAAEICPEISEALDIQIVQKVLTAKSAEDLPAGAGEMIAMMSLWNPKMKRIVAEMIQRDIDAGKIESEYAVLSPTNVVNDVVYKACLKDGQFRKYTSYIGKYMGEILREEYGIRRKKTSTNPSFIDKLLEIIRETIAKLKEHFYFVSELDSTCRTFAKHILANNPYFITSSLCKPGSPDLRVSLMDPRKILQDYPAERELIYLLDKHNIHIAGSLSMSMQGTVYRPDENPMRDLDFAALFDSQEELEETLLSLEPFKDGKLHHYRTIVDKADKEGHGTYTYFSLSVPFKVETIDKDNGHLVDVNTGKTLAVYHKSDLTIVEEGVTGKILDFFVKGKEAKTVPFKVDDQHTIQASHWSAAVSAKVDWVRLKDLFDYNRFITYEFLQHKKAVQTKIEKAEQNVKQETAAKLTMSKRQLLYKALDYSIRQYRHKRIAIDFAQKVLQNINDQVRLIDRKIADEQDPETKQTLYEKRARLLGEDKISALFEMVPVSQIFNEIKEEYEFYATPEDEDGADDETLQAIFPSPKGPAYVREQARIIVDHFDALVEESLTTIEEHTGLRLTLEEQITVDNSTSMMVSLVEDENEENQNINVDEDTHVDIGGGTSYKVRNKKNFETMSNKVKDIINSIVKVDASGTPIVDDLGTPQYLSAREVHGMLGDELSSMIESEDFCVKNTEGDEITYSFPALEKVSKKYSWVKQIIERLQKRPALIGAFYGVFRKDFIKRFIYKAGKGIIPVNETSVFGSAWKELNERLDSGTPVSPKSIYDASGVNKDKFEKSIKTIDAIIDEVDTASELSTAEVRKLTKKIVDAFSIVGLKVNEGPLKDMLADSDLKKNIKDSLQKSKQIIEALSKTSEEHIPSMMTSKTRPFYINILRALNIANDGHAELTYRQGGESRTSYTVPGYIETMVKKLKTFKGEALEEFLASEFKEVRGPFYRQGEHGRWLNTILGSLANTRTRAAVQSNLDAAELTHIDGVEYKSWTSEHITKGFIGMFLEGDFTDGDTSTRADYVWYHAPILSDSPVVKFIKLKRYKKPIDKTLREHMLPLFRDVVKQELMRMQHVEERAEGIKNGTIKPIANYDGKRGSSFCYFTEFNKPDLKDALLQAHKAKDTTKLNKIIDENLSKILDNEFEFWLRASGALYSEDVKRIFSAKGYDVSTEEKYRECLEDYYLNQSYASSQIIQILTTDPAFYKNGVEFQKRFKEVYAAGTKLNTQTRLGKKTQKVLYLKDKSGSSRVTTMIQKVLDRTVEQGYILPMDRDNILHKLDGYCATDGQAFRTLDSLKSIFDMMGILEEIEPAIDRIASGEWQMDDFYIVFQTLKPFYYNSIVENDGVGGKIRVGHQHKDSEFIPLLYETIAMGLNTDTEMQALQDFMVKHEIDAAVFESGVKTGGSFTIDIFKNERVDRAIADKTILIGNKTYQFSDKVETLEHLQSEIQQKIVSKEITQEEANAILDYLASTYDDVKAILEDNVFTTDEQGQTVLNTNAVKECPMEGYSIAMSTSANHLTDSETIYGTQFNSLITADLPKDFEVTLGGKKYDRVSIKKLYQDVKIENLLDNFESARHIFGSPEQLVKEIIKRIDSNSKYNKGIKEAIKLVQKKDPTTGRMITTFKIPLINPTMKDQLQEVVLSIFKNKITKQKIKGGTAFLVSDVGFTKELEIKYKTDKHGRTSIDYIPCYLPCWCKEMFKDVLRKRTSLKGVEYWELDIDAKDENGNYIIDRKLLDMVGYRIPTEHKYSMVPLRVVGFLPQQNGSSIMLPAESVVIFSGADYDIDKLFLMMYEYKKLKYDIPQAKADYTDMQISDVPFSKWLEQHKDKYTLKTPLYRKYF